MTLQVSCEGKDPTIRTREGHHSGRIHPSELCLASNPPESFYMFLGQYGQKTAHYWRIVSSLAVPAYVLALIVDW